MSILNEIFQMILDLLLPILVVILVLLIAKIIMNYCKYGTKIFASFKKYNLNGTFKGIIIDMITKENRKDIFVINTKENYFYVITSYDVFAIFVFDYNLPITGNMHDQFLMMNGKKIENIIPKFLNINKMILSQDINLKTLYINTKKECKINISEFVGEVYTLGSFSNQLYKNQHSKVQYTEDKMAEIKRKIEDCVNGNNKN